MFCENGMATFCYNCDFISFIPSMEIKNDHSGEEFILFVHNSGSIYHEIESISQSIKFFINYLPKNGFFQCCFIF